VGFQVVSCHSIFLANSKDRLSFLHFGRHFVLKALSHYWHSSYFVHLLNRPNSLGSGHLLAPKTWFLLDSLNLLHSVRHVVSKSLSLLCQSRSSASLADLVNSI